MNIYSPQRKAIYLSPNRPDLLHRRRSLSDQQNGCVVCALQSGKVSWQGFADWMSARGFRIEKARPLFSTLAAPGIPYSRLAWLHSCAELDRLLDLLEAEHNWLGCPRSPSGCIGHMIQVVLQPFRTVERMLPYLPSLLVDLS